MYQEIDTIANEYNATLLTCEYPDRTIDGCVIRNKEKNFIVIEKKLDTRQKRFVVGHEIGHIIDESVGKSDKYSEQKADSISIRILVSDKDLKKALEDGHRDIPTLCMIFGIPYQWMEKRIKQFFNI